MFIQPGEQVTTDWYPHTISVERPTTAGRDDSGNPVETFAAVAALTNRMALVAPATPEDMVVFEQLRATLSHTVYIPATQPGDAVVIYERDRIVFGTWPNGQPRHLKVVGESNVVEAGVLWQVPCQELPMPT